MLNDISYVPQGRARAHIDLKGRTRKERSTVLAWLGYIHSS